DFHNNCGYCGTAIPTPIRPDERESVVGKGDVDHFLPKSIFPELVYEWSNYIWCCKACNQHKREFHSDQYPLLDPCCEVDCGALVFVEDTGRYVLKEPLSGELYWLKRLENSVQKTLFNTTEFCDNRRDSISALRGGFKSVELNINRMRQLEGLRNIPQNVLDGLQQQIDDELSDIRQQMDNIEFYLLKQAKRQQYYQQYPLAAELLNPLLT
ncbi:MAG: hypothetical protein ACI8WB_003767, partial [Phenylobacterium sp.]